MSFLLVKNGIERSRFFSYYKSTFLLLDLSSLCLDTKLGLGFFYKT